MDETVQALIKPKYREVLGARLSPSFETFMHVGSRAANGAALGYQRAGSEPLFLERYLDCPIEAAVTAALGREVERSAIVEIGNFAAVDAMAMVALWGAAANDLGERSEVAVATLTAPLRGMFARIGVPLHPLAAARPERMGSGAQDWGRYYELDPQVCAGVIAEGQAAITVFLARRAARKAA